MEPLRTILLIPLALLSSLILPGLNAQIPDSVDLALKSNQIAIRLQDTGEFAGAREAYQQAIRTARNAGLPPSLRLRLSLNLISLYLEEGSYREAEAAMAAARDLARELPAGSCELAGLHNYGSLLHLVQGRLSQARKESEAALSVLERPECAAPEELASALQNLASVQMRQTAYSEARRNAERSLAILESVEGPHASQLVRLLTSLSTIQYLTEDWPGAAKSAKRALDLAEQHYGPAHPLLGDVLQNYSIILDRLHRGKEARAYRRRAKALLAKASPPVPSTVDLKELRKSALDVSVLTK